MHPPSVTAKTVKIRTGFGEVSPAAGGIMSSKVDPSAKPPAVMTMWSSAIYRGELVDKHLPLVLWTGASAVRISTADVAAITWTPTD